MTSAIEITQLGKDYAQGWRRKSVRAISDVSLSVAEGEAFGFIGPNGAGKSTTIRILIGAQNPTRGSVRLFGVPVANPESRLGMGYVPENPSLYDFLTPIEVLTMGVRLHKLGLDHERKHCLTWLEKLDLADVAEKPIRTFSKGMVQRVSVAHALAVRPRLLILDEPLSGLDPVGRRDVVALLSEFKRQGGTLFFTSHVLHDVERLADRFGLIHKGELRTVQTPEELVGGEQRYSVRSIGKEPVGNMQPESGGRWYGEIGSSTLWTVLTELQAAGHSLIEVRPALSLEVAFLKVIEERGREDIS